MGYLFFSRVRLSPESLVICYSRVVVDDIVLIFLHFVLEQCVYPF